MVFDTIGDLLVSIRRVHAFTRVLHKLSTIKKAHASKLKGSKRPPEVCAKISAANKGLKRVPFTPEHCANISAGRRGIAYKTIRTISPILKRKPGRPSILIVIAERLLGQKAVTARREARLLKAAPK
jgi:hypothetical protein